MIYKVPCPTNSNGIRLFKEGNQIAIQYEKGAPHIGPMALDSALGKPTRTVTFQKSRYGRDDLPKGTGISRSKSEMAPGGSANINDEDPDADSSDEVVTKLMAYLNDKLTTEQLNGVAAILGSGDDDAPDLDAGEPRRQASDHRFDRVERARLAADQANRDYRRMTAPTAAENAEFDRMFPGAKLILHR
jgi:hypothetical protein